MKNENFEQAPRGIRWGWALLLVLVAEALLIAIHVLFVAVYSHGIHPGEDLAYYQRFAEQTGALVVMLVGFPVMFVLCSWLGRRFAPYAWPTILAGLVLMLAVDIAFHLASSVDLRLLPLAMAWTSKLLGGWLGGRHAQRSEHGERVGRL